MTGPTMTAQTTNGSEYVFHLDEWSNEYAFWEKYLSDYDIYIEYRSTSKRNMHTIYSKISYI
jgi:hypothetical protein